MLLRFGRSRDFSLEKQDRLDMTEALHQSMDTADTWT